MKIINFFEKNLKNFPTKIRKLNQYKTQNQNPNFFSFKKKILNNTNKKAITTGISGSQGS